jgi:hypothetical protein
VEAAPCGVGLGSEKAVAAAAVPSTRVPPPPLGSGSPTKAIRRSRVSGITGPACVLGVGAGGVEELRDHLDDGAVSWALLRFQIGSGTFARAKLVAVHCNGEETPVMQRGWSNAKSQEMLTNVLGDVHATIEVTRSAQLSLDYLCQRLLPLLAADHLDYSPQELRREYERMIAQTKEAAEKSRRVEEEAARESRRCRQAELAAEERECQRQLSLQMASEAAEAARQAAAAEQTDDRAVTADEALRAVAADRGEFNWVLLEPATFALHGVGCGGLEEILENCAEDMVLFGALRLSFGSTRSSPVSRELMQAVAPRVTKYVFVHWVGPKISLVKRGKWNAKLKDAVSYVSARCAVTLRREAHRHEDLCLEELVAELRRLTVIDASLRGLGAAGISAQAYLQALQEERREREEAARWKAAATAERQAKAQLLASEAAAAAAARAAAEAVETSRCSESIVEQDVSNLAGSLPDLRSSVSDVRTTSGQFNWVLCGWSRPSTMAPATKLKHSLPVAAIMEASKAEAADKPTPLAERLAFCPSPTRAGARGPSCPASPTVAVMSRTKAFLVV